MGTGASAGGAANTEGGKAEPAPRVATGASDTNASPNGSIESTRSAGTTEKPLPATVKSMVSSTKTPVRTVSVSGNGWRVDVSVLETNGCSFFVRE